MSDLQYKFLKEGKAPATINRYISSLKLVLNLAWKKWEVIDRIPYIEVLPENNTRDRFLTYAEEEKQFNYSKNRDFTSRAIHLKKEQTKSKKTRTVPMTERVYEILWRRRSLGEYPLNLPHRRALKIWNKAKKAIGFGDDKNFLIHTLRHTFFSSPCGK
ncbi:MAG: hypothetical protein KAX49_13965 [Halanaerobiales bacterium]|nr:hypothetical protein [Halanaerobiales bacterium]